MTGPRRYERLRALERDQRRLAVLVVVLIIVATVFAGRSLLGGHGSSSSRPPLPRTAAAAAANHAVTVATRLKANVNAARVPAATTVVQLTAAESFELFEIRDPFQPPVSPTPDTTPPATSPPSLVPRTGQTVAAIDVFTDSSGHPRAHVRIASTVYDVGVGDTFAVSYEVVSLSGRCGQFLFGDSSFQLCEGQETIK
jgi:hypothetical protein